MRAILSFRFSFFSPNLCSLRLSRRYTLQTKMVIPLPQRAPAAGLSSLVSCFGYIYMCVCVCVRIQRVNSFFSVIAALPPPFPVSFLPRAALSGGSVGARSLSSDHVFLSGRGPPASTVRTFSFLSHSVFLLYLFPSLLPPSLIFLSLKGLNIYSIVSLLYLIPSSSFLATLG